MPRIATVVIGRGGVPQRPRKRLYVEGLRRALRAAQGDPVHGGGGHERRQLLGGERQRHAQARAPRRRVRVPGPGHRLPGRVPVGEPLQHPKAALRDRPDRTEHLRDRLHGNHGCYPRGSGITETTPCPRSRVKAPNSLTDQLHRSIHLRTSIFILRFLCFRCHRHQCCNRHFSCPPAVPTTSQRTRPVTHFLA